MDVGICVLAYVVIYVNSLSFVVIWHSSRWGGVMGKISPHGHVYLIILLCGETFQLPIVHFSSTKGWLWWTGVLEVVYTV